MSLFAIVCQFAFCAISVRRLPPENGKEPPQKNPQEVAILISQELRDYRYSTNITNSFKIGESVEFAMKNRGNAHFENTVIIGSLFKKHPDIHTFSVRIDKIEYEPIEDTLTGLFNFTKFRITLSFSFYQGENLLKTIKIESKQKISPVLPLTPWDYMSRESVAEAIEETVDAGYTQLLAEEKIRMALGVVPLDSKGKR